MVRANVSAAFPAALVTQKDIGLFTNEEGAVLTADSPIADLVLDVDDSTAFAADMWMYAMGKDGILLLQVNSVDAAAKTVTVDSTGGRNKDGTTDVALKQGDRLFAAIPAKALNQVRAELVAVETALGAGNFVAANADRVLFLSATGSITTDADFKYVSDQLRLAGQGATTGILLGGDAQWFRGAADRMDLTSGDTLNLVLGAFQIAGVTIWESDRDLAITLLPNSDATLDLGSAARRFDEAFVNIVRVLGAASDANALYQLDASGLRAGAGGAGALDALVARHASSLWKATGALAGDIRWGMSGASTPVVELRAATADANPTARLASTGLFAGAGGASALDVQWKRSGAAAWQARDGADAAYASVDVLSLNIGSVAVFEADRDLAIDLFPSANGTLDLGSATRRFAEGHLSTFLALGTSPASTGILRLQNNQNISYRNAADTDDLVTITMDSGNNLLLYNGAVLITNAGSLDIDGSFSINSITVFESDRDVAVSLLPNSDNTLDLGSAARRWRDIYLGPSSLKVLAVAGDANPALQVISTGIKIGAGGAAALDVFIKRSASAAIQFRDGADAAYASVDVLSLNIGSVAVFESDRDLAVTLLPNASATLDLGSSSRRWANAFISATLDMAGGANVVLSTVTGTKFGTGATQLLGFWGNSPVARPAAYTQTYATASRTHGARAAGAIINAIGLAQNLTIEDMPALQATPTGMVSDERTAIRNNFSDIAEQLIDLKTDVDNTAQVLNQVIDDLQNMGLLA